MAKFVESLPKENLGPPLVGQSSFDPASHAPAPRPSLGQQLYSEDVLDAFTLQELLDVRARIDKRLPASSLKDLDLSRELVLQMLALQKLQASVIDDPSASPAHRAQVANSLSQALSNLVKVQNDVYVSERFKRIEALLIDMVKSLPPEAGQEFLQRYEQMLMAKV